MRPMKLWAVVQKSGRLLLTGNTPLTRTTRSEILPFSMPYSNEVGGRRAVRVRILEDAAVKRAIAVLKGQLGVLGEDIFGGGGDADIKAAIRGLGGKP